MEMLCQLRQDFDSQGFEDKTFIAVGDGPFCKKASFRQTFGRTILIIRARKNLRICWRPLHGSNRCGLRK